MRERVNDLLEVSVVQMESTTTADVKQQARDGFKEVGEGVKKLTTWEDLSVGTD